MDDPGSNSGMVKRHFFSPKYPDRFQGPSSLLFFGNWGSLSG